MTPTEFINYLIPLTKQNTVLQSLLIAQICLESGYGKHIFHNNCLGIKCHEGVKCMDAKTKEVVNGEYKDFKLAFAVYDSIDDCITDYNRIMSLPRYKPVRQAKDYKQACKQIKLCGYATGKNYDTNLIKLIEKYKLYELDKKMTTNYPYEKVSPDDYIVPNFKYKEFFCKDGTEPPDYMAENIYEVALELQKVRDYYGKPIKINSAYRTKKYNDSLPNASKTSYHLLGLAVDVKPLWDIPINEFYKVVKKLTNFKGYGIGVNFLHLDLRKTYTVWNY